METSEIIISVGAVPVITAIVQLIKTAWPSMPARFLPLLTTLVGFVWVQGVAEDPLTRATILVGIVTGLAASGLYEAGRTVVTTIVPSSDTRPGP